MGIVYIIQASLKDVTFYFGILAGLFICFIVSFQKKECQHKKRQNLIRQTAIVSSFITTMDAGDEIKLEEFFHKTKRKNVIYSARYNAWVAFIYWIASQCATYSYSDQKAESIIKLGKVCFGENSISYKKLVACETIINYSTKLFLDNNGKLFKDKKIEDFDELFDMVDMIISSTYIDKY